MDTIWDDATRFENLRPLAHATVYTYSTVQLASQSAKIESTAGLLTKGDRVRENYEQNDYVGSPGWIWHSTKVSRQEVSRSL